MRFSHIQAVDGMFHIARAFDNDEVLRADDSTDPVRDLGKSSFLASGS
jgi:obg-like ATPase 1